MGEKYIKSIKIPYYILVSPFKWYKERKTVDNWFDEMDYRGEATYRMVDADNVGYFKHDKYNGKVLIRIAITFTDRNYFKNVRVPQHKYSECDDVPGLLDFINDTANMIKSTPTFIAQNGEINEIRTVMMCVVEENEVEVDYEVDNIPLIN